MPSRDDEQGICRCYGKPAVEDSCPGKPNIRRRKSRIPVIRLNRSPASRWAGATQGRFARSLYMTIRKKILLYSGLALGAFLMVVYFVSRFAIFKGSLLLLLMVAGVVHSAVLLFVLEEKLVARVESLNRKIKQITVSGDLSLRLDSQGKRDELSELAETVNAMLTAIQKAKFELLQAQESLRFHAEHDSLTGVLNRRAIRDVLRRELARCRRENQTLGVMLADVDHFKRINDRYGHGAGDAGLVTVVQRISSTLRPYDLVGRYGGEEFLIIAPGCDLELTQKLAERIRGAVGDELMDLGNERINVTVSVGVTLGSAESDPEFLVAAADSAMYEAKRNGRNRVEAGIELPNCEPEPTLRERR
jgi:diguanylate cyclase (GGDEF)-like protein